MLSVSSLLNPAPSGPHNGNIFPPSPESSSPSGSCAEVSTFRNQSTMSKHKMPKDAVVFTRSKPKGAVNFHPYEDLDDLSLHRVRKFQVYPFGKIQEYSRHIPYASGKKDFFEKTGRESFEIFQYVFKVPGDEAEYAVMWDYNIGLVRMTPFFKCCKYQKTTPAKMLNANPGLKEITHSITGGSIMAQGYWMPYQCAKAVCATFCYNISGALIPLFGPDFPALCTPADTPEYGRMVIDPAIINWSTQEAQSYRRLYGNSTSGDSGGGSRNDDHHQDIGPKRDHRIFRSPYDEASRRHPQYRTRRTYATTPASESSPYTTDTDGEISPDTVTYDVSPQPPRFASSSIPSTTTSLRESHPNSSHHNNSGWTPANAPILHLPAPAPAPHRPQVDYQVDYQANYRTSGPNPWLSAVPRFAPTSGYPPAPPHQNGDELNPPRSQPYPQTQPRLNSEAHSNSHSHSHPHTYHHHPSATTQRQRLPLPPLQQKKQQQEQQVRQPSPRTKHPKTQVRDGQNHTAAGSETRGPRPTQTRTRAQAIAAAPDGAAPDTEKNAALLLLHLSVRNPQHGPPPSSSSGAFPDGGDPSEREQQQEEEGEEREEGSSREDAGGLRDVAAAAMAAVGNGGRECRRYGGWRGGVGHDPYHHHHHHHPITSPGSVAGARPRVKRIRSSSM